MQHIAFINSGHVQPSGQAGIKSEFDSRSSLDRFAVVARLKVAVSLF